MKICQTENLRKEFGTLVAVNDVNLTIEQGQTLGLIGPNGAGKTTLLRMLGTLLRPTSGSAELFDQDVTKDYLQIRKRIGFLPDFFNLYNDLTISECLQFFARAYSIPAQKIPNKVNEVIQYIELEDKKDHLISNLSRGMVQRIGIGTLLVHAPQIFLLDEPASGLDPKARIQLRAVLKKLSSEGKTIIISSHILTELSGLCSHIAIMNEGKIHLDGEIDEIEKQINKAKTIQINILEQTQKALQLLHQLSDTEVISQQADSITIQTTKNPDKIAEINSHLVTNGIKVLNFAEQKQNLEDLFMKISKKDEI